MTVVIPDPGQVRYTFGGQIDVRVEVDTGPGEELGALWDEALWDVGHWEAIDPDWVDITAYVFEVSIRQGAERWGERIEAGTATVTVDNTTGIFSPESGVDSPFFREFRPGRLLRIVTIPDPDTGDKVALFTGRLDGQNGEGGPGGFELLQTLHVVDFMGDWANYDPLETTPTGDQTTSARVTSALDRYGWPTAARDIQTGAHNIATSTLSETTLEECQQAADAEGGVFYASKDGLATFKARDWLITDTRSTDIQGYVGYTDVPVGFQAAHAQDPVTSRELARVVNHAAYAREGGTAQEATDAASVNKYGFRSHKRTDLHNTSDAEVLTLANRMVTARSEFRLRLDEITIVGVEDPDNEDLNRLLWDTRLGDRLSVLLDTPWGWSVEREVHVVAMDHTITADDWTARYRLDDAQIIEVTYWILEDGVFGVLDETTRLL